MREDFELEELFEEPEELLVTAPAQPAPASEAVSLEGILEEIERTARYLRGKELLQRLLCAPPTRTATPSWSRGT
jgi:hypothetical protein